MRIKNTLPLSLAFLLLLTVFKLSAQNNKQLQFKSGNITTKLNTTEFVANNNVANNELVNGNYYRIIQFATIPTQQQKNQLKNNGIELLNYLPTNAFYASITKNANLTELFNVNAVSVLTIQPTFKLNVALKNEQYPNWAIIRGKEIEITGVYHSNISEEHILSKLKNNGLELVVSNKTNSVRFIASIADLQEVYSFKEFYYFEEKDMPGEPEGTVDRTNHKSNYIATDYLGGLKFDGTGVTVMLQDNSNLDEHIDYTGRFFNDVSAIQSGDHGEHTGGIIGAAGNLNPKGRGMAYGADVLVYGSGNGNYNDIPTLVANNDLTITSKSFGNGLNAGYTSLAQQLDQQTRQMPSLLHVFSTGNSGSGWSTITGGHKQGKNVIAVGNVSSTDAIANSSSRGPALDGRIKPDICAVGSSVYSTVDPNNYQLKSGTSMACPGVAGVLAQLYHAYKTNNGGVNPNAALMKASILNTAEDLGNVGPDYTHGWGRINARRAYNLVNNNNYFYGTIAQGDNNNHNITVPAGTSQLRVMVYWTDYEGAASAAPALVNDINMQVVDPASTTHNPWVLTPSSPNNAATQGVDALNNMEQVTIDNPTSGTYSVNLSGFGIPQGPQDYYLVYEMVQNDVVLTYPIGREGFKPGTVETIRWDAYQSASTFNLEYTIDNGVTWNTIDAAVDSNLRYYNWVVPNHLTGQALVRISNNVSSSTSQAAFSIIATPLNLNIDYVCPDSMQMSWSSVAGATAYEVSMLGNKYMDSVGVTNTNSYVFYGINPMQTNWFSVRALGPLNARGERAVAVEQVPGINNCVVATDAAILSLYPSENAQFLDCITSNVYPSLDIKNEGQTVLSNIPVFYQLNGGSIISETYAGNINPGATINFTFSTPLNSVAGPNNLMVWSDASNDGNFYNDSANTQFNFIGSTLQTLPWSENFESFALCGTANNCGLEVCAMSNSFLNEHNGSVDDIDWRTDQGGTVSNSTGPNVDFNPGTTTGKYLFLEASGGCDFQTAELISPCIDLTNISAAQLSFAYNMYGLDMGALFVDVFANGTWNNALVAINGNQGPNWLIETLSLSAYTGGIINLRFRGVTGNGYQSDLAIDDINVSGTVGVDDITNNLAFNIYPNPSNGIFNFSYLGETNFSLTVIDVNGKVVYAKEILKNTSGQKGIIDISDYSDGIYMLILTSDNERFTQKIIKN